MKFAFIGEKQVAFPVSAMCRVLNVSPSGYYAFCKRPASARRSTDARLATEIGVAHKRSRGIYGSPRVHQELRAHGVRVSKKRVERLMRESGLQGRQKRRFVRTTDSRHAFPIAPNLLDRHFERGDPERGLGRGRDHARRATAGSISRSSSTSSLERVVGWATSATNDRASYRRRSRPGRRKQHPSAGLVHHTDRGSLRDDDYRAALTQRGLAAMKQDGRRYDNAVAESFFATLKTEHVDHEQFASREQAHASIADYIERFYNTARRHSSLGYVSPIEFELRSQIARLRHSPRCPRPRGEKIKGRPQGHRTRARSGRARLRPDGVTPRHARPLRGGRHTRERARRYVDLDRHDMDPRPGRDGNHGLVGQHWLLLTMKRGAPRQTFRVRVLSRREGLREQSLLRFASFVRPVHRGVHIGRVRQAFVAAGRPGADVGAARERAPLGVALGERSVIKRRVRGGIGQGARTARPALRRQGMDSREHRSHRRSLVGPGLAGRTRSDVGRRRDGPSLRRPALRAAADAGPRQADDLRRVGQEW